MTTFGADTVAPRIPYTGTALDKGTQRREDTRWIASALSDPESRILLYCEGKALLVEDRGHLVPDYVSPADCPLIPGDVPVFLGTDAEGQAYFALDVSPDDTRLALLTSDEFSDLRQSAAQMELDPLAITSQGKALVEWHARNGYCPRCGHATVVAAAGNRRDCPHCNTQYFPRIDPAVIVLVTCGDKCLLATNASWPKGRFSTLAGYVEAGESPQEAVVREIHEEVGVHVRHVRYFAAQPWPYPAALMLGFYAECDETELIRDPQEIAAARWFTREEARALLAGKLEGCSGPIKRAIARYLIAGWAGVAPE